MVLHNLHTTDINNHAVQLDFFSGCTHNPYVVWFFKPDKKDRIKLKW